MDWHSLGFALGRVYLGARVLAMWGIPMIDERKQIALDVLLAALSVHEEDVTAEFPAELHELLINQAVDTLTKPDAFTLAKTILGIEGDAAPYPWCRGNPTVKDCIRLGYCAKDPNCGE